jgi:twitching motility protein PilU
MDLTPLLVKMVEKRASDLFITVGAPPVIKVEGQSMPVGSDPLTPQQAHELAYSVMDDEQISNYEETFELNMGLNMESVGRFRINIYRQRGEPALVARYIKSHVPSIEELGLPLKLRELIMEERGLLLVVGGTGTGKSTSLASMIDYRSRQKDGHILTIEDPIEFVHSHHKSLVNQREVGIDTLSYENALKNALRESPDVIMIGEIRDQNTMKHALAYAETGHLCISTLHANNANQALDRILNFFPETAHAQILMDLSLHLRSIISQRLANGVDGERVPAVEIMINTPFISELIQKGKVDKIKDAIAQSKGRNGQTFDDALYELNRAGKISEQEALRLADSRNNLSLRFRLEKGNKQVGTIKKDIVYDRKAPFSAYHSYKVSALKVDQGRREDMEKLLTVAIGNYFTERGYKENLATPDLEVQYILGLKSKKGLALEPIEEEVNPFAGLTTDTETHATLIINIVDTLRQKPVWRLTASTKLEGPIRSQEELNHDIATVLESFPPDTEV